MAWFKRKNRKLVTSEKKTIPDGLWDKCPSCNEIIYKPEIEKKLSVCHHCNYHFRISYKEYVKILLDKGTDKKCFENLTSKDFLGFKAKKSYGEQLGSAKTKTGDNDAINIYEGKLEGKSIVLGLMNFNFIGGSMGSVVGELVSRALVMAGEKSVPLILVCSSGGARMQEGAISLMQLAKTSTQLAKFSDEGGLFIPILTDPTTGGVTASYGMLGDIILAEPGALIGFAGPRVIKQTIGQDLPEGFQQAEFLLKKGFIDHIVSREDMKEKIAGLIKILK
tara:strand:+ start:2697 stop:3533 length:837 start_codon:yes stop_codon:yes gene_type:complete